MRFKIQSFVLLAKISLLGIWIDPTIFIVQLRLRYCLIGKDFKTSATFATTTFHQCNSSFVTAGLDCEDFFHCKIISLCDYVFKLGLGFVEISRQARDDKNVEIGE